MSDLKRVINWIKNSDLSDEQKIIAQNYIHETKDLEELKDFQISKLKDNLKINTRFLNKTVEDLEKTVKLLKDSNAQLGNFVKIASHDLKSPLRSIGSFSALLNKMLSEKLNEKESEYFNIIQSSATSMSELIDDLLLFTKINSEDLNIQAVELSQLMEEVMTNLNYEIEKNEVNLESNFKDVKLKCDQIKFKQILQNLISNSIKFSSFEGNKPHIVLDMMETENHWCFSVKDNGIGINEEFREVAFQEFKKLNGNEFQGTGMGLSIVQKIVIKHSGKIWIEPTDKGTLIMFTIAKDIAIKDDSIPNSKIKLVNLVKT